MENKPENYVVEQLSRLPFIGKYAADLGRRAVEATENMMGTERVVEGVGHSLDERDEQEANAMITISSLTTGEFHLSQTKSIVNIYARKALRHLGQPGYEDHLLTLKNFMQELPEGMSLEDLGLEDSEVTKLRRYI